MNRIAFFDVDKTILSVNSATYWIRRELRLGHLSLWHALRGSAWSVVYALGASKMERVIASAVETQRGVRESDLHQRTIDFWKEEMIGFVRPAAKTVIAARRGRGDRVYLLTSSSTYLASELSTYLGADGYLSNRLEVADGVLTGRLRPPVCFGEGKAIRAASLAAELDVPLSACSYYGDSYSDLPILLAVGEPVAVNPDPRLRREARRRGFRIENWDNPGAE